MNKITLILILLIFSAGLVDAAIIQVAAPADLNQTSSGIVASASDGDIIELTTSGGAYTWTSKISALTKSITIRAASGLTQKPVITLSSTTATFFQAYASTASLYALTFDGIEFVGNSTNTIFISAKDNSSAGIGGNVALTLNNCYLHGFSSSAAIFTYSKGVNWTASNYFSELKVTNCQFDGMATLFVCGVANATPSKITISNCYFSNMGGNVLGTGNNFAPDGFVIDHCTFDNCASTSAKYELYIGTKSGYLTPAIITNTLFTNRQSTSTAVNSFGTTVSGSPNSNNAVYYTGGDLATIYPNSLNYNITSNPVIVDKIATGTDYVNGGSDGSVIGYKGYTPTTVVTQLQQTESANFCISIENNRISILLSGNSVVELYRINGQLIDTKSMSGNYTHQLSKGLYIIRVDGKSRKISI